MLHNLEIKDRGIFLDEQEIKGITDFKLEKSAKEQASTLIIKIKVNSTLDRAGEKETLQQQKKKCSSKHRKRSCR